MFRRFSGRSRNSEPDNDPHESCTSPDLPPPEVQLQLLFARLERAEGKKDANVHTTSPTRIQTTTTHPTDVLREREQAAGLQQRDLLGHGELQDGDCGLAMVPCVGERAVAMDGEDGTIPGAYYDECKSGRRTLGPGASTRVIGPHYDWWQRPVLTM